VAGIDKRNANGDGIARRIGRPTDDPKGLMIKTRVSESDMHKIKLCCERLKLTQAELIRQGIDKIFSELNFNIES
jgi:hypothetical protein